MIRSTRQPSSTPPSARSALGMRSLTLKLTLAFLAVGLLGALLVAVFASQGTTQAFNQFITERDRPTLMQDLGRYYATNGSWIGAERVLQADAVQHADRPEPAIATADGVVVVGNERYAVNTTVSDQERTRGMPIISGTSVVGWLLDGGPGRRPPGSPEGQFLDRITQAILYSAIGATVVALVLGFVLARTLTQPLRELTRATQAMAKGTLGQQVTVRSRDELGVLAASFNHMSADLAQASTLRRQMTADIAHDLRTPLSVILGYTEALRDGKLPPEQDIFDTLHTEAQHLQHLIDDLRTLSLADAGELPLQRRPIAPLALLERAAAAHRANAQARAIALQVQAEQDLPEINVDEERIAQVLGNLLSNALRFTPPNGTITLEAEQHADSILLRVCDTGSGIAAEDLPHVFERFYRADPSRHGGNGSSGLGLAIAKGIVEAHGGTITVHSAIGQGTTFSIDLPLQQTER